MFKTIVSVSRTFVGTGILAMPYAFKNLGLVMGFGGVLFCWIVMTYRQVAGVRRVGES